MSERRSSSSSESISLVGKSLLLKEEEDATTSDDVETLRGEWEDELLSGSLEAAPAYNKQSTPIN